MTRDSTQVDVVELTQRKRRRSGHAATVIVATATLLLTLTGTSFADQTAEDVTLLIPNGGSVSGTFSATLQGLSGNGVEIDASNLTPLSPGDCYYVKYDIAVDHWRDRNGEHLGPDFCYGSGPIHQWKSEFIVAPTAPWVNSVTVWVCQNIKDETDNCSDSSPIELKVGGDAP